MTLHPQFIREIEESFDGYEAKQLLQAITDTEAITSIRVNTSKTALRPAASCTQVPWCAQGYYLPRHEQFTFDPLLHSGLYYVQDASSMIISHIINKLVTRPVKYLDLCAAPGGKSTAVRAALPEGSLLVCNEVVPQRANILKENIIKWGNPDCIVASSDSSRWGQMTHFFDVVAADVPCSGEGMFRKDSTAVEQWTPELVEQCAERQRLIIDNVWDAITPGGLLIYSTCTFNRAENEAIIEYIIDRYGATPVPLDMPDEWGVSHGIDGQQWCYRFLPHRVKGEGLFVCVLQKPDEKRQSATPSATRRRQPATKVPQAAAQWLTGDYNYSLNGDTLTAIRATIATDADYVARCANVLLHGVELGSMKGRDIVPAQSLALTTAANRGAFARADVDYTTAIAYLRGDAITLGDVPRGTVLVEYQGAPLGFAKQVGNRANNLYPRQWRIRSTYAPTTPPCILCQQ